MNSQIIREIIAALYLGKINSDAAAHLLVTELSAADLAEFCVESFNRGWISRANLGIDDDGNLV